ncbi:MAG: hypothetical protein EBQ62_01525, partial [Alphaproteobacteria bacterium]|nr:hypothetical protein [Alphaproteobacteria bacterium]
NNYGEILKDTFAIPEYFISIACLNKKHSYPKTWLDLTPKIQQQVEDTYKNWVDVLSNRPNRTVKFEDLKALLTDIINVSEVSDFIILLEITLLFILAVFQSLIDLKMIKKRLKKNF